MTEEKEKQLLVFIKQAEELAREWTIAQVEGRDTHSLFTDKMYLIQKLAKGVLNPREKGEAKKN